MSPLVLANTRVECLLLAADSTDRRNTLAKAFRRGLEVERPSGSFVHATSDGIELALRNIRQIYPLWEVLPQQTVGVLVRSALPGLLRIAKEDLHVRRQREALMVRHL